MAKNSKKIENGYRKKVKGSLYQVIEERNELKKEWRMAGENGTTDNGKD